jgi:hypothetical protein
MSLPLGLAPINCTPHLKKFSAKLYSLKNNFAPHRFFRQQIIPAEAGDYLFEAI